MFGVLVKLFSQLVFDGLSTSLIVTVAPLGFTWSIIKKKKVKNTHVSKKFIR
jgi:hypothetical protein